MHLKGAAVPKLGDCSNRVVLEPNQKVGCPAPELGERDGQLCCVLARRQQQMAAPADELPDVLLPQQQAPAEMLPHGRPHFVR